MQVDEPAKTISAAIARSMVAEAIRNLLMIFETNGPMRAMIRGPNIAPKKPISIAASIPTPRKVQRLVSTYITSFVWC